MTTMGTIGGGAGLVWLYNGIGAAWFGLTPEHPLWLTPEIAVALGGTLIALAQRFLDRVQ